MFGVVIECGSEADFCGVPVSTERVIKVEVDGLDVGELRNEHVEFIMTVFGRWERASDYVDLGHVHAD